MRANRLPAVLTGLSCALASAAVAATQVPTPPPPAHLSAQDASRLVAELGAPKAAEQVLNDSPTLEAVAAGVASGVPAWLDVGAQLIGVADSYLRDRLTQSFSIALQHDASAVLARGGAGIPVPAVCGYDPFTAIDVPPTRRAFDAAVAVRERAVSAVRRAELAAMKGACLEAVAQLRTTGAARYQP
jgi:hypothetical protein